MLPAQKAKSMEQWRDIPEYEGLYEASNMGRIRTNANKVTSSARFSIRHWKQRVMKLKYRPRGNGKRDARVCLWKDGKEKTFLVSRLVAMAWCDGYQEGMTVDHVDGNPENNAASNLEWVTRSDNVRRAFKNGLYHRACPVVLKVNGAEHSYRSLSEGSRALGYNTGYLSNLIKKGKADGIIVKTEDE